MKSKKLTNKQSKPSQNNENRSNIHHNFLIKDDYKFVTINYVNNFSF